MSKKKVARFDMSDMMSLPCSFDRRAVLTDAMPAVCQTHYVLETSRDHLPKL